MNISLGIVGLPNVGKSTLFNILTKNNIPAENYPFCTIDPNVGIVEVADDRLNKIAQICNPAKIIPAVVEFYDIAGLVKGACSGEGLGNQFLNHIRDVSAIVHVVRAFENQDIIHVEESVDPQRDLEIINTELILKDITTVDKRISGLGKLTKTDKTAQVAIDHLEELLTHLNSGKLAIDFPVSETNEILINARRDIHLLTDKPVLYVLNVTKEESKAALENFKSVIGDKLVITMDIKLEAELTSMSETERLEYMEMFELKYTGLQLLTRESYNLLGLASYFTEGKEEVRAWTFKTGMTAPQAAGVIHTDFQKNFIAADICSVDDYLQYGGWEQVKQSGKMRLEGKQYFVVDGDIVVWKFNKAR